MNEERTPRLTRPRRDSGQEQIGDHVAAVSIEQLLVVGDLPLRSIAISATLGHLAEVGLVRRPDHYTLDEKAAGDLVNPHRPCTPTDGRVADSGDVTQRFGKLNGPQALPGENMSALERENQPDPDDPRCPLCAHQRHVRDAESTLETTRYGTPCGAQFAG